MAKVKGQESYPRWKVVEELLTMEMVAFGQRIEQLNKRILRLEIVGAAYLTLKIIGPVTVDDPAWLIGLAIAVVVIAVAAIWRI